MDTTSNVYLYVSVCEINTHQVANGDNIPSLSDLHNFSFLAPFLAIASCWLGCAAHSMRDITREPMWPSEELKNKSVMTLELVGFVKQSTVTSHSPTARLDGDTTQADSSSRE